MPNEYSDLIGDDLKPAPTNEYSSLVDPSRALIQVQNAEGASPDEAAQTQAAAKRLGIPYGVGALDPKDTQLQARRAQAQTTIQKNPFIQDYIDSDPAAAQLSGDDWDKLDGFTKAWRVLTDSDGVGRLATMMGAPAVAQGAKRGFASEAMGTAAARGRTDEAKGIEQYVQTLPEYPNGIAHYMDLVGGLVGQLGYQATTGGVKGTAVGTATGAAVGGPLGIIPGAGAGFLGGVAVAAAESAYGRTLMALDKAEADSGQTIDPAVKHAAAGAVGLLNGGANFIGVKTVGTAAGELLSDAAAQAVVRPGVAQALRTFGTKTARGGAEAAALMGGLTLADQVLQDSAKTVSPGQWQTIFNDPAVRAQMVDNVATALADGFVLGGALHAIPAGKNLVNDMRLSREAVADRDNLSGLIAARDETLTAGRSPDSFEAFAKGHGDENVVVTAEGVAKAPEVLQDLGAKPLPDGSVEVPLATYAARIPEEVHRTLADDIIHRDEGISVNQSIALQDYRSATSPFMLTEQRLPAANEPGMIFDTWESRAQEMQVAGKTRLAELQLQYDMLMGTGDAEGAARLNEQIVAGEQALKEGEQPYETRVGVKAQELKFIDEQIAELKESGLSEISIKPQMDELEARRAEVERWPEPESPLPQYRTGVPTVADAFHGTNKSFIHEGGFSNEALGTATEAASAKEGHFFARNPETSNSYTGEVGSLFGASALPEAKQEAWYKLMDDWREVYYAYEDYARANQNRRPTEQFLAEDPVAKELKAKSDELTKAKEDFIAENIPATSPQMIQARIKFDNPFVYDFGGTHYREETYYDLIKRAKAEGHDGVILLNTSDGGPMDVIYTVFDTGQISHRLDNDARRASASAQRWLARGVDGELVVANDQTGRVARDETSSAIPQDPVSLATTAVEREMYLEPLFQGPSSVLMQADEFRRYNKLLEERANKLHAAAVRRAEADARARQRPDYLAREADVTEEVTANVDNRPVFAAERLARTGLDLDGTRLGDFKLDPEIVDAVSRPGAAELLRGLVRKGGMHPDELAGLVGYGSGADMVQELIAMRVERDRAGLSPAKYREAVIKADVQEKMLERFGDLDENVRAEALDAAVRPEATELLNAEREALATLAGAERGASADEMRAAAAVEFAAMGAADAVQVERYTRAVGRAGREAELALLRQDFAKAFDAKQRQMQAMIFAEQAKVFARTQAQTARRLEPYATEPTVKAAAQDYVDQLQGLLVSLGQPIRRDLRDLRETLGGISLEAFVAEKNALLGGLIPDADLPRIPYAQYTVADATQLADLVKALDFQGRAEKKISVEGAKRDLEEVVAEVKANLFGLRDRWDPGATGAKAKIANALQWADARMVKMEQLLDWFDHGDPDGILNRAVVQPLHKAQARRDDMFTKIGAELAGLRTKGMRKFLGQSLDNKTLMDPFFTEGQRPMALTGRELIGMMLNLGNASNREALVKGYGWAEQDVMAFVDRHAKKEHWEFVQGVWNIFKGLEPEVKAAYRELAGVGPEMIQANKVFTPFGTAEGGYFPLIRDPIRSQREGAVRGEAMFERGQFQPFPANGYTKERTGAVYPLLLNPDFIAAQLRATAHDIAFRGSLIDARKVLMHPEVQSAVKQTFGPEYAKQFFPYLRDIANDGVSDVGGVDTLSRILQPTRQTIINSMIGFNLGTVYIHGGSAALNSIGELANAYGWKNAASVTPMFVRQSFGKFAEDVGKAAYNQTVARITKEPAALNAAWKEAMEQSAEMRNRLHNFDRDLNVQQDRALGKGSAKLMWNSWATGMVAYSDLLSAVPTYMAARDLALANGVPLEKAVALGEKVVRQAHGSSGIVDRALIQRGSEAQKMFTMFFGYFSHNYNRNRDTWRLAMEGKDYTLNRQFAQAGNLALKVTAAAIFYALLPSINHARVRHPHSGEGDAESYARWLAGALVTQASGDIPLARDLGRAIVTGNKYDAIPLSAVGNTVANTINNILVESHVTHGKVKPAPLRDAIDTAGIVTGVSTRQVGKMAQFLLDVRNNKEHPEGFYEWYHGLNYGHAKQKAKH